MSRSKRGASALLGLGFLFSFTSSAHAQDVLDVATFRVTATPDREDTPSLGRDPTGELIVFSTEPEAGGPSDIQYQRIDADGTPSGQTLTVPEIATLSGSSSDDRLNDTDDGRVVFIAYDEAPSGRVAFFDLAEPDREPRVLAEASALFESRISGDFVIWHQANDVDSEVRLYQLSTASVRTLAAATFTVAVDIGARFAVYSIVEEPGTADLFAFDLQTGETRQLSATPDVSEVAPRSFGSWVVWQTVDITGNRAIFALDLDSGDFRTVVDDGSAVFSPAIDGDLIAYESNRTGDVDVYVYRISTGETFAVTDLPGNQFLTDVFESRVSYLDDSEGQDDVYYANLDFRPAAPPFECPGGGTPERCDRDCASVRIEARKDYAPSRWNDGEACLCEPTSLVLPDALTVLEGNAGNHWVDLTFEDGGTEILCRYRGGSDQAHPNDERERARGLSYPFDFCTGGRHAGDVIETQYLRLFLANGDSLSGPTVVQASLDRISCRSEVMARNSTGPQGYELHPTREPAVPPISLDDEVLGDGLIANSTPDPGGCSGTPVGTLALWVVAFVARFRLRRGRGRRRGRKCAHRPDRRRGFV